MDNTLSVPDTVEITSATFVNGGFNISWEKSSAYDFDHYDLYHSTSESFDDSTLIHTSNNVDEITYFMSNTDPLIFNYFYVVVTDSFDYSSKSSLFQTSLDPKPIKININSISYDENYMNVSWNQSPDNDFSKYELYMGTNTQNTSLIEAINDRSITSYQLSEFNPYVNNYFNIIVYDTLNQKTIGDFLSNDLQPKPEPVVIYEINAFGNEFIIDWSSYLAEDFQSYSLYQAFDNEMANKEVIYTSTSKTDTSFMTTDNDYEQIYYFQVSVVDDWDYDTLSNIVMVDPEYYTFSNRYQLDFPYLIAYGGVQNYQEQYAIIGKSNNDVVMVGTNREGTGIWSYSYNYGSNETPVNLIEIEGEGYVFLSNIYIGYQNSYIRITKTDYYGQPEWDQTYGFIDDTGNELNNLSTAHSLVLNSDGGYTLVGQYQTGVRDLDLWILKLSSTGNIEQSQFGLAFDQTVGIKENGYDIIEELDGNIFVGSLESDSEDQKIWLAKWDFNLGENGDTLWSSIFNPGNFDYQTSVVSSTDGGYAISGYSSNLSNSEEAFSWIIKTDSNGDGDILATFGGNNHIYDMIQDQDGNYILVGKKFDGNSIQAWLISLDMSGNQNWERLYGEDGTESFYSVFQTNDSGYLLIGKTDSHLGYNEILHIKTDPLGNVISDN